MNRTIHAITIHHGPAREQGAILVTSLILLLVMTLIGVTALQTTTLEERMAGNAEEVNRAFQAAEAALREGEDYLEGAALDDFDGTVLGLYEPTDASEAPIWESADVWDAGAKIYAINLYDITVPPKYIIEELDPVTGVGDSANSDMAMEESGFYRVTSRANGANENVVVILQSTYKR